MVTGKNYGNKKLKLALGAIILLCAGAIFSVFLNYRHFSGSHNLLNVSAPGEADIEISQLKHEAIREGIKEWRLEARTARVINAKKQAVLTDLTAVFFLKNSQEVHLTAKQGVLDYQSNNIEVTGNVTVQKGTYSLKTEQLHYDHGGRIMSSRVPVEIHGESVFLAADSMFFDLNTNKTILKGNVDGTFGKHLLF